jgi:predicted nuclease of predicted toxin-antitoxin system
VVRTIRFHLDEHAPNAVADGLRRLGIDVTTTTDARLLGADDLSHIAHGMSQVRVIFSEDADYLEIASTGMHHAGLAYCQQGTRSIGQIIRALELIWEVYEPEEMHDRIEFI